MGNFALKITEPSIGLTDRTNYVTFGDHCNTQWTTIKGSRGSATVTLYVPDGDAYTPVEGTPMYIYDGSTIVWAGTIDKVDTIWREAIDPANTAAGRSIEITGVTLEQVFDTILVPPNGWFDQTCGHIVNAVLSGVCSGVPVTAGTISDGVTMPSVVTENDVTVWQLFQQLATASGFVCYVGASDQKLYFCADSTSPAPVTPTSSDVIWETAELIFTRQNYRNRQLVRVNFDAFTESNVVFNGDGVSLTFDLPYLPKKVNAAYISGATGAVSEVSSAIGSFTAQPSAGDTITVNDAPYEFVTSLDNTQEVQVLIGASLAATIANLIDAINSNPATAGVKFSLPTWENDACNASSRDSTSFNLYVKWPGAGGDGVPLTKSCSHFSWSASTTTGGVTGTSQTLKVGVAGVDTTADLFYTAGSTTLTLLAPVPLGAILSVSYYRLGADCIAVENTADVTSRATLEHGTGKYQVLASDTTNNSAESGLLEAQAALEQYGTIPQEFDFQTVTALGIQIGQQLNFDLTRPTGIAALVNSTNWIVQEIDGQLMAGYKQAFYTVKSMNLALVQTVTQAFEALANPQVSTLPTTSSSGTAPAGSSPGGGGPWSRTLDIYDTTPITGAGPGQPTHPGGTLVLVTGTLKQSILADLTVQLNIWSMTSPPVESTLGTFTIPAGTTVYQVVQFTNFDLTEIDDLDVLSWDILASDGSSDLNAIASFTAYWQ